MPSGEALKDRQEQAIPQEELPEGEVVYAWMDGSLILTQAGWKEVNWGAFSPAVRWKRWARRSATGL